MAVHRCAHAEGDGRPPQPCGLKVEITALKELAAEISSTNMDIVGIALGGNDPTNMYVPRDGNSLGSPSGSVALRHR